MLPDVEAQSMAPPTSKADTPWRTEYGPSDRIFKGFLNGGEDCHLCHIQALFAPPTCKTR